MRFSLLVAAVVPGMALAQNGYGGSSAAGGQTTTIHVTSTVTGTVTNVVTATMTKSNSSALVTPLTHANTTTTKAVTSPSATSALPVQVTNAAPRSAMDVALAGIAGAALYILL
ncbi:uncharacterized protein PV09_04698 [Verruconis gallopava]|uniref:Uncharacterized protein n=1 Tax=Verruconis gallopava TaxID=253628 RepID=A0A0D2AC50_9PEZI|nr:uncharacterized protein PV09_04698 [Verruconis gallopava]KIW04428.1 hypothetical protein PV09_04698 [Verruconis gallopava]